MSPRASPGPTLTFSVACAPSYSLDDEERQKAWHEEWMEVVDEEDQPRLLEWEARRLPSGKTGETLEVSFQLPVNRSSEARHHHDSSDSNTSDDEREEDEEETGSTKLRRRKERLRKLKAEDGRSIEGWKLSRGQKKEDPSHRNASSESSANEQETTSVALSPVLVVGNTGDFTDLKATILAQPKTKEERKQGATARSKQEQLVSLTRSFPPALEFTPASSFHEASATVPLGSLSAHPSSAEGTTSLSSSSSSVRSAGGEMSRKGESKGSSKKKSRKARANLTDHLVKTTSAMAEEKSVSRTPNTECDHDVAPGSISAKKSRRGTKRQSEEGRQERKSGERPDLDSLGLDVRYQIEWGRVTFSEDFLFYSLVFGLVVFVILSNAFHELQLTFSSPLGLSLPL